MKKLYYSNNVQKLRTENRLSQNQLAKEIGVPVSRIQDLLHDRRKMTADTSVRLGIYFGVSEDYFLNIQNDIDLRLQKKALKEELDRIPRVNTRSA